LSALILSFSSFFLRSTSSLAMRSASSISLLFLSSSSYNFLFSSSSYACNSAWSLYFSRAAFAAAFIGFPFLPFLPPPAASLGSS